MSDVDNEKFSTLVEDDNDDSFSKFTPNTSRKKRDIGLRQPRQKYCERWEEEFQWLKADKVDESLGICTICNKQLVCKKSHLERHQNSFRHQRLAGFEVVTYTSDNKNGDYLDSDNVKKEYEHFEYEELDSEELSSEAFPNHKKRIKVEPNQNEHTSMTERNRLERSVNQSVPKEQKAKLNRLKLLKSIDNDRSKLNEYYYSRLKKMSSVTYSTTPQPQRDTFDLFFESVSVSVKTLPPKLAYEIKSQISQLLTEFELRALCEKEALEQANRDNNNANTVPPVIVAQTFDDTTKPIQSITTSSTSTVPHLVYTFQPKL